MILFGWAGRVGGQLPTSPVQPGPVAEHKKRWLRWAVAPMRAGGAQVLLDHRLAGGRHLVPRMQVSVELAGIGHRWASSPARWSMSGWTPRIAARAAGLVFVTRPRSDRLIGTNRSRRLSGRIRRLSGRPDHHLHPPGSPSAAEYARQRAVLARWRICPARCGPLPGRAGAARPQPACGRRCARRAASRRRSCGRK